MSKQDSIIEISPEDIQTVRRFFSRNHNLAVLALLLILGTFSYLKSFTADFQFDDYATIVDNPLMKRLDLPVLWDHYKERFLTNLTFVLNYLVGGLNVFGWHLVNNLIHMAVSFLVYHLTKITFQTPQLKNQFDEQSQYAIALFSSLIFLVHPIQTQAVTYIVQRATSLSALFYFGTMSCYIQGRIYNHRKDYILAIVLCLFGILTKPTFITLPLVVILYDVLFFGSEIKIKPGKLLLWIFFTLAVVMIPLVLIGPSALWQEALAGYQRISMGHYLFTQLNVIGTYIRLLFLPFHQTIDYDYGVVKNLFEWPTIFSLLIILGLIFLALKLLRKERFLTFGILWFFATLGPQSSIFSLLDVIFEHRVYLACYGFCLLLTVSLFRIIKSFRSYLAVMMIIVGILAAVTYQRNDLWSDPVRFMEDVVAKSPHKARPHNNLGFFYFRGGRFFEAEAEYRKAVQLDPNYLIAYHNLATVYLELNKIQPAKNIFEQLVRRFPGYPDPYVGLGLVFQKLDDNEKAFVFFQKAIQINPYSSAAYVGLGNSQQEQGHLALAKSAFEKAIWLNPDSSSAYYNLGNVFYQEGLFYDALLNYQKAVKRRPDFSEAYNNMGNIYFHFYDYAKAIEQFHEAVRYNPSLAEGYFNLANTLYEVGSIAGSEIYIRIALELYRNQNQRDMVEKIEKKLLPKTK